MAGDPLRLRARHTRGVEARGHGVERIAVPHVECEVIEPRAPGVERTTVVGAVGLQVDDDPAGQQHRLAPLEHDPVERLDEDRQPEHVPVEAEAGVEVAYGQRDVADPVDLRHGPPPGVGTSSTSQLGTPEAVLFRMLRKQLAVFALWLVAEDPHENERPGPALHEEAIEAPAWADLEAFTGARLFEPGRWRHACGRPCEEQEAVTAVDVDAIEECGVSGWHAVE